MTTDAARDARTASELGAQLDAALERIGALGREMERTRDEAAERDSVIAALLESWRTIDGRTLRYESGHDAVRELSEAVERLRERLEQEAALRREAIAALAQTRAREDEATAGAGTRASDLSERLALVEQQTRQAAADRQRLASGLGALEERAGQGTARLDQLELRIGATRDAEGATTDGLAQLEGRFASIAALAADLEVRTRETQAEQRVIADAVAALRTSRDRDAELVDLLDHQRATRQRLEERMVAAEEGLTEIGRSLLEAAEQHAQLRVQLGGVERMVAQLASQLRAQGELGRQHLRALVEADNAADARAATDGERRKRERAELLRRFDEASDLATQEGPL